MTPGKIVIKENKVYFEPDGLKKPEEKDYSRRCGKNTNDITWEFEYSKALKKYEASKELIEVSNAGNEYFYKLNTIKVEIKNNQRCKAEITGKTALITEL